MESHREARLWNEVFNVAQHKLGIPSGTVRADYRTAVPGRVKVGYQRADVPRRLLAAVAQRRDKPSIRLRETGKMSFVDRIIRPFE
jgi:hypothetical protein